MNSWVGSALYAATAFLALIYSIQLLISQRDRPSYRRAWKKTLALWRVRVKRRDRRVRPRRQGQSLLLFLLAAWLGLDAYMWSTLKLDHVPQLCGWLDFVSLLLLPVAIVGIHESLRPNRRDFAYLTGLGSLLVHAFLTVVFWLCLLGLLHGGGWAAIESHWRSEESPLGYARTLINSSWFEDLLGPFGDMEWYWTGLVCLLYGATMTVIIATLSCGASWRTLCVWASAAVAGYGGLGPIADIPWPARVLFALPLTLFSIAYLVSRIPTALDRLRGVANRLRTRVSARKHQKKRPARQMGAERVQMSHGDLVQTLRRATTTSRDE